MSGADNEVCYQVSLDCIVCADDQMCKLVSSNLPGCDPVLHHSFCGIRIVNMSYFVFKFLLDIFGMF